MLGLKNIIYKIATLWFLLWGGFLYSQNSVLYLERTLSATPELTSANPALLQTLQDSLLFNAKAYYNFSKGDFVNYFEPNQNYTTGVETASYNRFNAKTAVYGLASYNFTKGKNSSGTTFLYPYRTPFNFTPRDETTKGDRRIEEYRLAGGLSYQLLPKLALGVKADYQTISFAKLKDMRNINDILDVTISGGITYNITLKNSIGISYNYNRYIENMRINEYGNLEKEYYALINKGAFMGLFELYGDEGILNSEYRRPWVDIVHYFGVQYRYVSSKKIHWFTELKYQNGKGFFGKDSDNSAVYMRHKKQGYSANSKLIVKAKKNTQIIGVKGNYATITNNEQLFREVITSVGNTIIQYYGERETINKKTTSAGINYKLLWGDVYLNAPWEAFVNYTYNNIRRNVSSFPYYRTQNITWHTTNLGIGKTLKYKKTDFYFSHKVGFTSGNGGTPNDGKYVETTGNTAQPDYLNNLLHKEREYFTTKRILSETTFRVSRNYNGNEVYVQLQSSYINPFKTEYLQGNFFNFALSLGLTF